MMKLCASVLVIIVVCYLHDACAAATPSRQRVSTPTLKRIPLTPTRSRVKASSSRTRTLQRLITATKKASFKASPTRSLTRTPTRKPATVTRTSTRTRGTATRSAFVTPSRSPSKLWTPTRSSTPSPAPPAEYLPGASWGLVWADEFTGPSIDSSKWGYDLGGGGWGNNELQIYTDSSDNSFIQDGLLNIKASKRSDGNYTSARMVTRDKYYFTYGKIAIRAKLPYGKGMWSALWMLGQSFPVIGWPECGEIDILELVGGDLSGDSSMYTTVHYSDKGYVQQSSGQLLPLPPYAKFSDAFHVFEMERTPKDIVFRLDGSYIWSVSIDLALFPERARLHDPHYLLMNVAIGGSWPGSPNANTVFPQSMLVDWVRYYQWMAPGVPPAPPAFTPLPGHVIQPWRQYQKYVNDWKSQPFFSFLNVIGLPTENVALCVNTLDNGWNPWDTGIYWPTAVDVRRTDVLQLSFYARRLSPTYSSVIRTQLSFEMNYWPYIQSLSQKDLTATSDWKYFSYTFSPVDSYPAGSVSVKLLVAFGPQEFEISEVKLVRL